MNTVKVEIFPHPDVARRGEAVMQLKGLHLLPSESTYSISSLEGAEVGDDDEDWPGGDHVPIEPRVISGGVEFTITPEITNAAALKPGVPVVVSIPMAGVRAELRWPNLPVSIADGAGRLVMTLDQRNAAVEERNAQLAAEAAAVRARDAERLAATIAATRALEAELLATQVTEDMQPGGGHTAPISGIVSDAKSIGTAPASTGMNTVIGAQERHDSVETAAAGIVPSIATSSVPVKNTDLSDLASAPPPGVPPSIPAARRIAQMGSASVVNVPSQQSMRWLLLSGAAVASAVAALALVLWLGLPARVVRIDQAEKTTTSRENLAVPLRDVFSPGVTSPLGKSSSAVAVDTALQLADAYLHGEGVQKNNDEARFWLRHSLRKFSDDPRLAWALTQLGAIYVQSPSGPADYDRAAALWEIAAARNDPIAHCFLAALHEQGLVNSSSKDSALQLYRDARRLGGCPNVDQAIQRLSR
ncbi:MAG: sel1 repeat family protein [Hyphomicrobium sp.]|nr:sel1 repeat family protein [Hyphomicrobium sp.]